MIFCFHCNDLLEIYLQILLAVLEYGSFSLINDNVYFKELKDFSELQGFAWFNTIRCHLIIFVIAVLFTKSISFV